MSRLLFSRFPRLRETLAHLPLCDLPTPVERADGLTERVGLSEIWIKRDDLSAQAYGGNKPRKLEFLLGEALAQGRIEVHVKRSPLAPQVIGDAELLLQVFLSIILNSIESFDRGGCLNIEIKADERQARLVFKDNGRGILSKDLSRIFNPFYTTKEQNLGLGLAVSHQIVDAHQGMIQVKSRSGRGTTVNLSLPLFKEGSRQTLNA